MKCLNREMGPFEVMMNPMDFVPEGFEEVASRLFGQSPIAGVYFEWIQRVSGSLNRFEDCVLVQVRPGLLAIVSDDRFEVESHRLWKQVCYGGSSFYNLRQTWRIMVPGVDVDPGLCKADFSSVAVVGDLEYVIEPLSLLSGCVKQLVADRLGSVYTVAELVEQLLENGLSVVQMVDLDVREVDIDHVLVVRNSDIRARGHGLVRAAQSDSGMASCFVLGSLQVAVEYPVRLSNLEYPDGYCYLQLVQSQSRLFIQSCLGAYPSLRALLKYRQHLIDEDACVAAVRVVEGVVHVASGSDSVASVVSGLAMEQVLGGSSRGHQAHRDRCAIPGLKDSEEVCAAYVRAVAAGKKSVVVVYSWEGDSFGKNSVSEIKRGFIECRPDTFGKDGNQDYVSRLVSSDRCVVMLPSGVKLVSGNAVVGSDLYPTVVVLSPGSDLRVRVVSGVTQQAISEVLDSGVVSHLRLAEHFGTKQPLLLRAVPLLDRTLRAWQDGKYAIDYKSSGARFVAEECRCHVMFVPERGSIRHASAIELSDPLDDWKPLSEYRLEGVVLSCAQLFSLGQDHVSDFTKVSCFRYKASGRKLDFELGGVVTFRDSDTNVSVDAYGVGDMFVLKGSDVGDLYSVRTSVVADSYCFDGGGPSDDEFSGGI